MDSSLAWWDLAPTAESLRDASTRRGLAEQGLDPQGVPTGSPLKIRAFRGHSNAKNFTGLAVRESDGLLACGSECGSAFVYHRCAHQLLCSPPYCWQNRLVLSAVEHLTLHPCTTKQGVGWWACVVVFDVCITVRKDLCTGKGQSTTKACAVVSTGPSSCTAGAGVARWPACRLGGLTAWALAPPPCSGAAAPRPVLQWAAHLPGCCTGGSACGSALCTVQLCCAAGSCRCAEPGVWPWIPMRLLRGCMWAQGCGLQAHRLLEPRV